MTTAPLAPPVLSAPEGTKPGTVWFWLLALTPILNIAVLIPTSILINDLADVNFNNSAAVNLVLGSSTLVTVIVLNLVQLIVLILFPILDWLALRGRGVPRPFHWAWSLFVLVIGTPLVYVIGRTVVAKRRTGKGLAPLWVYIGLGAVDVIVGLAIILFALIELITAFNGYLVQSAGSVL